MYNRNNVKYEICKYKNSNKSYTLTWYRDEKNVNACIQMLHMKRITWCYTNIFEWLML